MGTSFDRLRLPSTVFDWIVTTIPNIGRAGIRQRAGFGGALLAATLLVAVLLILSGWPRELRLLLAIPFFGAGLGLFQAKDKT